MANRFSVEAVFKAKDRFSQPVARMRTAVNRFTGAMGRGVSGLSKRFDGLGVSMGAIKTGALALGAAGAVVGGYILKSGADFEEAISAVGAVSLQTRQEISALEAKALELGKSTKFTATQAAQGMELLARAGFKNEEILSSIDGVLSAAAAEGIEMAEVAGHMSNVLKGMGLQAKDAGRVTDVLALASASANTSISLLGESMSNVSATARQFGIPLEDTVAAVAALQDVGLDASVAGSALNTMLTKLAKPTTEVAAKMKEMGVTFQDSKGNMLPFSEVMANLSKAAEKSGGNMAKAAFFADLVGLRGQKAAANLSDLFGSGKITTLTEKLKSAGGAAKTMADLRMDNLKGDFTLLQSAVDGVAISVSKLGDESMRELVRATTDWVSANQEDITSNASKAFDLFSELASLFGGEFKSTLVEVKTAFASMMPETDGAEEWGVVIRSLAVNLGKFAAVSVVVLGAVAAGFVGLGVAANAAFSGILEGGKAAIDFVGSKVFAIVDWFEDLGAKLDATGNSLGEKMLDVGKHVVTGLVNGIVSLASAPVDAIASIGAGVLKGFKSALGIASPSREMASAGRFVALGLAQGLRLGKPAVDREMGALVGGTIRPALALPRGIQGPAISTVAETVRRYHERSESVARSELTIRDLTGRAELKSERQKNARIRMVPSGAF